MALIRHISVEDGNVAALDLAHPGDEGEQSRFADAVGANQPRHALSRNIEREVVERERLSVAVSDPLEPGDNGVGHCGSFTARSSGQGIFGSVRTKPRPRTPVFTRRWYLSTTAGSAWSLTRGTRLSGSPGGSTVSRVSCPSVATKRIVEGKTYWSTGPTLARASSQRVS